MKLRLDKYLADMGIGTRSEVKRLIAKGLVCVDNTVVKKPETKVDTDTADITCQGIPVGYTVYEYYMLNKPAGVVSSTEDNRDRTVMDLLGSARRKDMFPVGRLDKDTEGLLLITNDGDLAHRLLSPRKHVDKTYYAKIDGCVTEEDAALFLHGLDIGEKALTLPAKLEILTSGPLSEIQLTIQEGKFHQVKRMFEAIDKKVLYLKRLRMGTLVLDEKLASGEYRKLTEKEIEDLKNDIKRNRSSDL